MYKPLHSTQCWVDWRGWISVVAVDMEDVVYLLTMLKGMPKGIILKMKGFLLSKKRILVFFVMGLVGVGIFGAVSAVYADKTPEITGASSAIAALLVIIIRGIVGVVGPVLLALVSGVIRVSQYNDFINSLAVVNGWVIVRDVANMFFIVVLLIIAFGTILGQEDYHYKKLLPKMLIMAVVVNFSRTIVGLMVDFAQVIMLTFVNGYSAAAGGNFANVFKITELLQYKQEYCGTVKNSEGIGPWQIFGAYFVALIMVLVSFVTVFVILAVLILRVIMIWILTILSPIAFLAGTFPQGQKYYTQWWEEFKNQVMVGPMLAFFLWLSLVTVGGGDAASQFPAGASVAEGEQVSFACSAVGSTDALISYIIGIFMLLAGVQMSQQMGGVVSGIASKAKGFATKALKVGAVAAGGAYAWGAGKVKAGELPFGVGKYTEGIDLNPVSVFKTLKKGFGVKGERTKRKGRAAAGAQLEKGGFWGAISGIGAPSWVEHFAEGFLFNKGVKRAWKGKRGDAEINKKKAEEEEALEKKEKELFGLDPEERNVATQQRDGLKQESDALGAVMSGGAGDLKAMPKVNENLRKILEQLKKKSAKIDKDGEKKPGEKDKVEKEIHEVEGALNSGSIKLDPSMSFYDDLKSRIQSEIATKDKEVGKIDSQLAKPAADPTNPQYIASRQRLAEHKQKAEKYRKKEREAAAWTPIDYEARAERRQLAAEDMKKINTTNDEELVNALQAALTRHDPFMAQAVAYQAAAVGHLNELLNGFVARNTQVDADGKVIATKDESFAASGEGLSAFVKDIFIDSMGVGEQAALSMQNDLSASAQKIHHWAMSETVGANMDGSFYQRTSDKQNLRVGVERSKIPLRDRLARGNRFAMMEEKWVDEKDHSKGKRATLTPAGLAETRREFKGWEYSLRRGQVSPNLVINLTRKHNNELLKKVMASLPTPSERAAFQNNFLDVLEEVAGSITEEDSGAVATEVEHEIESAKKILQSVSGGTGHSP